MITGRDVVSYLGQAGNPERVALAEVHLPVVTAFVKAYTRGRGFIGDTPTDDLEAVIVSVTARLITNPEQVASRTAGPFQVTYVNWAGFNLLEQAVLHRYRRRAA